MKYKKIKVFWLMISLIAIVFFSAVKAATTDIIINEIGAFEPSDHEWIEIFNRGGESADLSGWKFFESGVNHGLSLFQGEDLILTSGEYAIIAQNADNFTADHPDFSGLVIDSAWSVLSSDGEPIELRVSSSASSTIESFTYLSSPLSSLERKDPWLDDYTSLNWQSHSASGTPGLANSNYIFSSSTATATEPFLPATSTPPLATSTPPLATSTPPLATSTPCVCPAAVCPAASSSSVGTIQSSAVLEIFLKVVINEFMADPLTGAKEWIELYNGNNLPVDLTSWQVFDGVGKILELSGAIPANGFSVFGLSSAKLNNGGDRIVLKDKNGTVADSVSYGSWDDGDIEDNALVSEKGGSVGRKADGLDSDDDKNDFALSLAPTQNQPNLAVIFEESDEKTAAETAVVPDPVEAEIEESVETADNLSSAKTEVEKTIAKQDNKASVQGIVSAPPGVLGAQIFYLANPCLQVYSFKKDFPDLKTGDEISATGVWSESQGEKRLKISAKADIKILKRNNKPEPEEISASEAEQYPGCLVKVAGEVMEKKSSSIYLDDGFSEIEIFAKSSAGIKISEIKEGNWLTATGIVSAASGKIRILPRSQADLVLGAVKGETASSAPLISTSAESKSPAKRYWWLVIPFALSAAGYFLWKKYGEKKSAPEKDEN